MNQPTIPDARAAMRNLQTAILSAIQTFESSTGLTVNHVNLEHVYIGGTGRRETNAARVEVQL